MSAFTTRADDEGGRTLDVSHGLQAQTGQRHDRIRNNLQEDRPALASNHMSRNGGGGNVDISAGQKMLSAVSGSFLTSVLVTPLDVVRVRLQSQPASSAIRSFSAAASQSLPQFANLPPNLGVTACCREVFWVNNNTQFCVAGNGPATAAPSTAAECAVQESQRRTFTSTFDGLRKIARHEGVSTLWRGLSPTLVMAIPANVIYFTGYDSLRYSPHSPINRHVPETYAPLVAGSLARICAATVISPVEMFRTRLQASTHNPQPTNGARPNGVFITTLRGLRDLVHAQGYTSLWRGLTLTLWRDVPFSGIYWWGYEVVRNRLTDIRLQHTANATASISPSNIGHTSRSHSRDHQNSTTTFTDSFIAGGISGTIASIITTPFDVGKTRRQVIHHYNDIANIPNNDTKGALRPEERSMPRFLWHIWQEEGVAGLWRGWAARCLKVAPACAIMISSYEIGKMMARGMNERREGRRGGSGDGVSGGLSE
ncbi:hypothetical protein FGG08_006253 [Glutinoglossum americanum]|uniref:Mitochondrial carrier protein n=1 Tax=Glutinoglossum americanum TaxID=1670608 RepID=A0A9P8KV57_9PEZI|nr:hypothetical protein FGG08_006253 [Glutinoglossum americanum]